MLILVMYDIEICGGKEDRKRLRDVSKYCERYGVRVQNSVFEVNMDYTQYLKFRDVLSMMIDRRKDSLRYYVLGNDYNDKKEIFGRDACVDVCKPLLI